MLNALLLDHLRDPGSSWSCGRFGAIRIETPAVLRPVAYETISRCIDSWGHGLASPPQVAARNEKVAAREEGLGHRIGLRQQKWLQLAGH